MQFFYVLEKENLIQLQEQSYIELEIKNTYLNNYYLFINEDIKILVKKISKNKFVAVRFKNPISTVDPKDARQSSLYHSLTQTDTQLTVLLGTAGTGKTLLTTAYAMYEYDKNNKKLYMSKAAIPVGKGKAFGPVPGDIQEKYAPFLDSFKIILQKILGEKSKSYVDFLIQKSDLQYQPIEFVRGNTYENATFILDECQNLTWHELKTVISRIGDNCKLILLGDIDQSDLHLKGEKTGVEILINSQAFKNSEHTCLIELKKQYRGPLADLVYKIDRENE
jgi:PhoH-like ATPase